MTSSDLAAAVRPVAEALEALGVPFHLTGSVASSAHGVARASLDADIVADLQEEHVQPLVDRLGSAYYIPVDRLHDAVRRRASCNLIHMDTAFKIDLFMSRRRPFDYQAASRARADTIDSAPGSPRVPIASAEDTILAKLEWFRRGGEASERQWWDIVGVLRVSAGADRDYLRRWASELGVSDLLARALVDAGD